MASETMMERLRRLRAREALGAEFEHRADFVRAVLAEPEVAAEAARLPDYARRTQAERYWLEDALEHKEFVTRQLAIFHEGTTAGGAFHEELARFRAAAGEAPRLAIADADLNPQLGDRSTGTPFDRHYLYHPAWAARVLARTRPAEHVDIGSILHFATLLSAFVPTRFYDLRPAAVSLPGLTCGSGDLTALPFADGSIASLSCMHTLEHIGLGRYGDPIDPDGDLKAIAELKRVVAPGGDLLVVTPVGRPRICFNAHRVYDPETFASYFSPFKVMEFALIEDNGERGLMPDEDYALARAQDYGCGCFWFRRVA